MTFVYRRMKWYKVACVIAICSGFSACNTEKEEALLSKWHLIEQLMDPGDGSGMFQPVSSDKTVSFFEDGSVSSEHGSICIGEVWSGGNSSSGTYSEATMTIDVDNCTGGHVPLSYQMDGGFLILNYACIEACREKYEQVQ